MAKEELKRRITKTQNGSCALSNSPLPDETCLYDTDRIKPKAEGGEYTDQNTRTVVPTEHMKRHNTLRVRTQTLEELKTVVDDRRQYVKLKVKIFNQLLAYKRYTDVPNLKTVEWLEGMLTNCSAEVKDKSKKVLNCLTNVHDPLKDAALSVKSVGPMTVAHCLVYIDLEKARHASSVWAYAGLDKPKHERYTKGKSSGGNKTLRTALYTLAVSQVKGRGPYREIYDRVKAKLEISDKMVESKGTKGVKRICAWKDTKPSHRHGAALRAIMKHFLADYWFVGRTLRGLDTSPCYAEAHLGATHRTIMPEERGWKYK